MILFENSGNFFPNKEHQKQLWTALKLIGFNKYKYINLPKPKFETFREGCILVDGYYFGIDVDSVIKYELGRYNNFTSVKNKASNKIKFEKKASELRDVASFYIKQYIEYLQKHKPYMVFVWNGASISSRALSESCIRLGIPVFSAENFVNGSMILREFGRPIPNNLPLKYLHKENNNKVGEDTFELNKECTNPLDRIFNNYNNLNKGNKLDIYENAVIDASSFVIFICQVPDDYSLISKKSLFDRIDLHFRNIVNLGYTNVVIKLHPWEKVKFGGEYVTKEMMGKIADDYKIEIEFREHVSLSDYKAAQEVFLLTSQFQFELIYNNIQPVVLEEGSYVNLFHSEKWNNLYKKIVGVNETLIETFYERYIFDNSQDGCFKLIRFISSNVQPSMYIKPGYCERMYEIASDKNQILRAMSSYYEENDAVYEYANRLKMTKPMRLKYAYDMAKLIVKVSYKLIFDPLFIYNKLRHR